MKTAVKKIWIEALTSGDYKQTKNALKDNDGFCCLGVLCDIYSKKNKKKGFEPIATSKQVKLHYKYDKCYYISLSPKIQKWAGIQDLGQFTTRTGQSDSLANLNDSGKSFSQIAKVISKHF